MKSLVGCNTALHALRLGMVFTAAEHFGPMWSFLFTWGLCGVVPVVLAAFVAARASAQAKAARRAAASSAPLAPGVHLRRGRAVVSGKVVFDEGATVAVRVEIHQKGVELKTRRGWTHTWTETHRSVETHRFSLRMPDGRLLPVIPDNNTLLVDRIDHTEPRGREKRMHVAALQPDEQIFVSGDLVEEADVGGDFLGYRDMPLTRLVMRGRRRLVLSAEPLEKRHWARARFHLAWLGRWTLALGFIHGLLLMPYHLRAWTAPVRIGTVESARTSVSRHSRGSTTHYKVTLDVDGQMRTFEVDRATYLVAQRGVLMPFRDAGPSWQAIGARPTVNRFAAIAAAFLVFVLGSAYKKRRELSRPWYEGNLVQPGTGRLQAMAALLLLGLVSVAATACGPNARKGDGRVPIGLESNEESPGDAVTSPNTPPGSPGVTPNKFGPRSAN